MNWYETETETRAINKYILTDGSVVGVSVSLSDTGRGTHNYGYSTFLESNGEWVKQTAETMRNSLAQEQRLEVINLVLLKTDNVIERAKYPDIIVRGPLSKEKYTSTRYIKLTERFIDAGYTYWSVLFTDEGAYWFHTKSDIDLPLDNYPSGLLRKSFVGPSYKIEILSEETIG